MSIFDNLAEGLENESLEKPLLAPGIYNFKIHKMEKQQSDSGFEWIGISLQLVDEAEDTNGEPMSTCFINHMLSLTPNEYNSETELRREVAKFLTCFQGSTDWDETFESYIGLEGQVKTKIKRESTNKNTGETYPEDHAVAQFIV